MLTAPGSCSGHTIAIAITAYPTCLRPPINNSTPVGILRCRLAEKLEKFGERAFCYAGPSAWNTLPRQIRETTDTATFRKLLKTHYFTSAFDVV